MCMLFTSSLRESKKLCVSLAPVAQREWLRVRTLGSGCKQDRAHMYIYIYIYIHMYLYMYIYILLI